jgi:vacuolar-type H+-ATPase subunit H
VKRRQIEDTTAARLAEIVAAAEQAAKQVIDEAEAEARDRLSDAHEEADRIVAERLAALGELIDEIGAQAEALKRGAEALQAALVQARLEAGAPEAFGGSTTMRRSERAPEPDAWRPPMPSLTVVGALDPKPTPEPEREPDTVAASEVEPGADAEPDADRASEPAATENFDSEPPLGIGTPAGARLLATQMAVSGSSRDEIEARLRTGFAIADTRPILDAILGPER